MTVSGFMIDFIPVRTNMRCVHPFLLMRIHCSQNNYSTLTWGCNVNFVYILCTYQRQSHLYIGGSGLETFLSCIRCWPTGMRQLHNTSTSPPHFIFVLKLTSIGIFDFWPDSVTGQYVLFSPVLSWNSFPSSHSSVSPAHPPSSCSVRSLDE